MDYASFNTYVVSLGDINSLLCRRICRLTDLDLHHQGLEGTGNSHSAEADFP